MFPIAACIASSGRIEALFAPETRAALTRLRIYGPA